MVTQIFGRKLIDELDGLSFPGSRFAVTYAAPKPAETTLISMAKLTNGKIVDPGQIDPVLMGRLATRCEDIVPGNKVTIGRSLPVLVTIHNVDQLRLSSGCPPYAPAKTVEQEGSDINVPSCFASGECAREAQPPPGSFAGAQFVTVPRQGADIAAGFAQANGAAPNGATGAGARECRIFGLDCIVVGLVVGLFVVAWMADGQRGGLLTWG